MRRGKKLIAVAVCAAMMFGPMGTYGTPVSYAAEQGTQVDGTEVAIDATNFPDEDFRSYVTENCDTDDDGKLSEEEISSVTEIDVSYIEMGSLQGIEFFTALTSLECATNNISNLDLSRNTALASLDCRYNNLSSLDVSKNTALTVLYCGGNNLSSLDVSKNTVLTVLYCGGNNLSSLDVSKNTALTVLYCGGKNLSNLDVSKNTALTSLSCSGSSLSSLDVSKNTALTELYCYDNNLSSLNVSGATALTILSCYDNNLSSLDVSKNTALTELKCYGNELSSLNVSGATALTHLDCKENKLSSLDVSKNTALTDLICDNNKLSSLDVSKNTALTILSCDNNKLSSLDVSRNTALTDLYCGGNNLSSLNVIGATALTWLYCYGNKLSSLDVSKNTALTHLDCIINNLSSLDVSKNTALTWLRCSSNNLSSLDVSKNTALTWLECDYNHLSSLDVSRNTALTKLECDINNLSSLDVSKNTLLVEWNFSHNYHAITLSADNTFDMSTLTGMDVSKVSDITGGTIKGNNLTVDSEAGAVTYTYDCGNGKTAVFKLIISAKLPVTTESISSAAVTLPKQSYTYTGSAITPAVTITCGGKKLAAGKDYTVAYSNNKAVGMATVTITGKGSYTGTVTKAFTIVPASTSIGGIDNPSKPPVTKVSVSSAAVTLPETGYTYTGSAITPAVTVTYGGKKLAAGADYTVAYSNNKAVGKATVTITGKGSYTGTVTKTFTIVPASTTIKSLANATKGITVKWKRVSDAGGYNIYRSKNGGKYSRIKTVTSGKTVSYTDKSATTNGAKYRYKIIAYKKVGKTTYKSAYSPVKTTYRISAPKLKTPSNKPGRKLAVKWAKNKRASGYQLQYAANSKFKSAKTVTVKKASTVSKVISKLKKNRTYSVRIRAYKTVSGKKYYSAWSSKKSVKVIK